MKSNWKQRANIIQTKLHEREQELDLIINQLDMLLKNDPTLSSTNNLTSQRKSTKVNDKTVMSVENVISKIKHLKCVEDIVTVDRPLSSPLVSAPFGSEQSILLPLFKYTVNIRKSLLYFGTEYRILFTQNRDKRSSCLFIFHLINNNSLKIVQCPFKIDEQALHLSIDVMPSAFRLMNFLYHNYLCKMNIGKH